MRRPFHICGLCRLPSESKRARANDSHREFRRSRGSRTGLRWLSALLLLVVTVPAAPQDRGWLCVQSWRQRDGLPQDSAYSILRTRDGYLWIGTRGGLCRFDGVRFTIYDDRDRAKLRENEVQALAEDVDSNLWIATYGGGVSVRKRDRFTTFTTREGLINDYALSIDTAPDGRVWIGTDGGLSCLHDGQFQNFTVASGLAHKSVRTVFVDDDSSVWAGTDHGGVHRIHRGQLTRPSIRGLGAGVEVRGIRRDRQKNLWIACTTGLYRVAPDGETTFFDSRNGLPTNRFGRIVSIGPGGDLWFLSDSGLIHYDGGAFHVVRILPAATARESVDAVHADLEGNVWVALAGKGVYKLRERLFATFTTHDGLPGQGVSAIIEDGRANVWVGTTRGLSLRTPSGFRALPESGLPVLTPIVSLLKARDGVVWVGSDSGLFRGGLQDPGNDASARFSIVSCDVLPRIHAKTLFEDRDGVLWVGTNLDGLLRIDGDDFSLFGSREGLAHQAVRGICQDSSGALWVGTRGGLNRLKEGKFTTYTRRDGLAHDTVETLYLDRADTLWIGTRAGLNRLKDGKFTTYTINDGLYYSYVNSLAEDDHGNMWMGSARGPFCVEKKQLEEFAAGSRRSLESRAFGLEHGLNSTGCAAGYHPSTYKGGDGRIWLATQDGVSVVDPTRLAADNAVPAVRIEEAAIDRRTVELHNGQRAPPGRGDLEFRYTGLSLVAPEKVRFRYKLDGYESDWVEAENRRAAFYSNIPPGQYTFRVTAANGSGGWNENGAAFSFTLAPHFYQTGWFYLACGLVVALSGFGMHSWRTRQFRRRQTELLQLVAERERAEEALRESEERYRRFFDDDLAGAFIATTAGRILACNPAFARIFGFASAHEAVRFDATQLYPSLAARDSLLSRLKRERRIAHEEIEMRRVDGKAVHVVANVIGNFDWAGNLEVIKGYVIDASERKHLENQLRQSQKMEAVGQLAGGIAHDFNNLLTGILSYSELLLELPGLEADARANIVEIRNAGERAASLTHQLLAFSRRQILQPRILDLNTLIRDTEKLLRRLIGEDVELRINLSPAVPRIKADPSQIHQVLLNLSVNARDAMPRGGKLLIETTCATIAPEDAGDGAAAGQYVRLAVSDTGCGMPADVQARMFEPFFTTKGPGRGTGLGLSTVYGIVQQTNGRISVRSAVGSGTTFEILLPSVTDTPRESDSVPPIVHSKGGSETVLLVEDNDSVRKVALQILQTGGYEVIEASNAEEALRICEQRSRSINLVLTDVVMPDMNGPELVERVRRSYGQMKVLYMSGYTHDALVHRGGLVSGTTILEKPFKPRVLLEAVRTMLDRNGG